MATKLAEQSSPKLVTNPEKEKPKNKTTQTFFDIMGTRFQKTKLTYANCNQDICDLSKAVAAGEGTCGSGDGGWGSWGLFLVFSFLT